MTNTWYTGYLPINSNGVFDNTGARYNVSLTVNEDALFDAESYKNYSPAYLAAGNILLYGFFCKDFPSFYLAGSLTPCTSRRIFVHHFAHVHLSPTGDHAGIQKFVETLNSYGGREVRHSQPSYEPI